MQKPSLPNEEARLEALARYKVLDSAPELNFDRVTTLAARLFEVPIALVTLVDDQRQWFKSCIGLDFPGTSRDVAFCAHTILRDEVFTVADATLDPRFRDNPLVTGAPFIRFYAGAPLITSDGFRLGSLCLIDTSPRTLSPSQTASLQDLAAIVMQELEARRTTAQMAVEVAERQAAEARKRAVLDAALDGIITINHEGKVVELNRAAERMFGYPAEQAVGQELAELIIPPAFRAAHRRGMAHFLATGEGPVLNQRLELSAVNAAGQEFPVELTITRIAADGPPLFTGHIRDLTVKKQIEETLRVSEERLRLAMDTTHQGTWDWNLRTGEVHWSAEHNVMYDLPVEQRVGSYAQWLTRVHPEDQGWAARELQDAAEQRRDFVCELRSLHRDGSVHWIAVSGRGVYAEEGRLVRMLGVVRDITAEHQHESLLRQTKEEAVQAARQARQAAAQVRMVLESISDAFLSLDRQWCLTYLNPQAERLIQRGGDELIGRNVWEQFPEAVSSTFEREFRQAVESHRPAEFEEFYPPLDAWLHVHAYPSKDGLSVYIQDITARKRTQSQLEDSHHLLQSVIDGSDNLIFLKDTQGRYLMSNPAMAASLGLTPQDLLGKDDTVWFPPEAARQVRSVDQEILRTGGPVTFEFRTVLQGSERVFLSTKSAYRDARGNLLGVLGIVREITEQQRAAENLRQAKEEAERANRAKSEFLSRMSHELRTPLNAILGFGQLLEMDVQTDRQQENVEHILKGGKHLLGLINEVLDIARIESGHMEFTLEALRVGAVLGEAVALVQPLAAQRGIRISRAVLPLRHRTVLADHQRLSQVLINLLSNAVKYNRPGGTVSVACDELADEPGWLRLGVTDTGPGIAPENLDKLFTPFERLGAERTAVEGSGIGLALSKRLVEAMGGRIGVDTKAGRGSTFYLELPAASHPAADEEASAPAVPPLESPAGRRSTVLCIEDNLSNYSLVEQTLERNRPNIRLLGAMQGQLGLDMARQHHPDLILLDLQLPDLAGDALLQRLRGDQSTRDIPVILVSADATKGQAERLLGLGAQAYLTKPLDIRAFLHSVDQVLAVGS